VGRAVVRNKVKRAVKQAFWDLGESLPPGHDYVVVARPGVEGLLERDGQEGIRASLGELLEVTDEERLS
jgi:ribonuclease P protein component